MVSFLIPFVNASSNQKVGDPSTADFSAKDYSGALFQYPNTYGDVNNPEELVKKAHDVREEEAGKTRGGVDVDTAFNAFVCTVAHHTIP